MKQNNLLTGISHALILAAPLFLAGCESISSPFNNSSAATNYDNYDYNKANSSNNQSSKGTSGTKKKSEPSATTLVEPGISTVRSPKTTSTTTSTVPLEAPMVPGTAPAVGQ